MRLLCLLSTALLLASCSSSSLVVGQTRTALHPSQVKVYLQAPKRFDQIALVNTDDLGVLSFTGQGHLDVTIDRAKRQAAKVGANGLLIQNLQTNTGGSFTVGSATVFNAGMPTTGSVIAHNQPKTTKNLTALAIFVHEE